MYCTQHNENYNAPCLRCEDREVGCHSICAKYIKYRKAKDKELEERYKEHEITTHLIARRHEAIKKITHGRKK